jgi:hypothetical protein
MTSQGLANYVAIVGSTMVFNDLKVLMSELEASVKDFDDNAIKKINLGRFTKDTFKFSIGQQASLRVIYHLVQTAENDNRFLHSQLVENRLTPKSSIKKRERESDDESDGKTDENKASSSPNTSSSSIESAPGINQKINHENVVSELFKFISKQLKERPNSIKVLKRSTESYPFKLEVRCFKCDIFSTSIRVVMETSKGYTRFRGEKYIAHVKNCGDNQI